MRPFKTIQSRIVALCALIIAVSLVTSALVTYALFSRATWKRHDDDLRETVDTVAKAFQTGIRVEGGDESEAAHHMLNELHFPNRAFSLFTAEGDPFPAPPSPHNHPDHVHGPAVTITGAEGLALARERGLDPGANPYVLVDRRTAAGPSRVALAWFTSETSGARYLIAAEEPNAEVEASLALLRNAWLIVVPFFIVVSGLGGLYVARTSLAPVATMSRRARSIGAANLGERLPVANEEDEIGGLALTFNDLLDRLERAFERMRQFTADASHELRTPIAAVRGEAQVALTRERDAGEYRESIEVMLEETEHMARIVEDLFTLARADAGELPLEARPFDLDELVADCQRTVRALAGESGVALDITQAAGDVEVYGDEALVRRALLNLMTNAIKFTARGGSVRVTTRREGEWAQVDVVDTGFGIAAEDLERVFERFYRVDKARSRSEGGAGLGLSIVRWVVESHGGSVTVESEPGRGSAFTMRLPLGAPPAAEDR